MKKILVIHPDDRSTDFLKPIYSGLENVTLITGGPEWTQTAIVEAIEIHDQVIMMGHGYPGGLFGMGFKRPTVINHDCIPALRKKDNSIFIWCNADQFVRRYELKGFFTGMFISEVGEALYCGLGKTEQNIVDESNNVFAKQLGKVLQNTQDPKEIHNQIYSEYGILAETNNVADYNHSRLYFNEYLVV
jgi:hypothetical protein